jgi:ABC-2 type transport system permease protein
MNTATARRGTLIRLLLRRHGRWTLAWLVVLIGMCALTVPTYQSTYASAQARADGVARARTQVATTALYGALPEPGNPAQIFAWEMGAFATMLAAVMAVLLAVRLTRAAEDDGTLEIVRSTGVRPFTPLGTAMLLQVVTAGLLGGGIAAGLAAQRHSVDGVTSRGSLTFGGCVAATFLLFALITTMLAQVLPSASATRAAGGAVVAGFWALRAWGDAQDAGWPARFGPMALRAAVQPFTDDSLVPLVIAAIGAVTLAGSAAWLWRLREFDAGLIRTRTTLARRLRVRTLPWLLVRLRTGLTVPWTIGVAAGAVLFTAMGSSVVDSARAGDLSGGLLGTQLNGRDPVDGYFGYVGTILAVLVTVPAVLSLLTLLADEREGRLDPVRATGRRRGAALAAQLLVTVATSLVMLALAAGSAALVAPQLMAGGSVDGAGTAASAAEHLLGQWPAVLALTGCCALLVGQFPRLAALAWLPLAASTTLTLLGQLLGAPDRLIGLSVFGHVGDGWWATATAPATRVLVAVTVLAVVAGLLGVSRRDTVGR